MGNSNYYGNMIAYNSLTLVINARLSLSYIKDTAAHLNAIMYKLTYQRRY